MKSESNCESERASTSTSESDIEKRNNSDRYSDSDGESGSEDRGAMSKERAVKRECESECANRNTTGTT